MLKASYSNQVRLIYKDTDSFIFRLECEDLENELRLGAISDSMNFSNFPVDHPMYDTSHYGELGLLKSEAGENYIRKVVALKPECYSLLTGTETIKQNLQIKDLPQHHHHHILHNRIKSALTMNESDTYTCCSIVL